MYDELPAPKSKKEEINRMLTETVFETSQRPFSLSVCCYDAPYSYGEILAESLII